jgi:ADP-ribosyl-[dinitrogen reductase] hydrolase
MARDLLDRYQGTLTGVHAGDSLGAPYEKKEPEHIASDLADRGGLVAFSYDDPWGKSGFFPAGRPTDDTELTAALAQSLVERKGSEPHHQYDLFRRAVQGESFVWEGIADGFGGTTRLMLDAPTYAEALQRVDRPVVPSNGSLMRSAPLALWGRNLAPAVLDDAVRESSRVTHLHESAVLCSVVYTRVLTSILHGATPHEAWEEARSQTYEEHDPWIEHLMRGVAELPEPEATNVWLRPKRPQGRAGTAYHTLHIALWSTLNASSFADGLECAVRFAGDTDTQAAVAGGLLGAHYGLSGIPREWQDALKGRARMLNLAQDLYTLL